MNDDIKISSLNDFMFCPRSIYFHNLYQDYNETLYHTVYQQDGRNAHRTIEGSEYSSRKSVFQGMRVRSEEFGLSGMIDIFDAEKKELVERKKKIKRIYLGNLLQVHAQYFCLVEMGYEVRKIKFHSLDDNKSYPVEIPSEKDRERMRKVIEEMKNFDLEDKSFTQNPKKCRMCIYRGLCDYYENDEQA